MMSFDVMFFSSTQTHWVHWEHQKVKGFDKLHAKSSPFSLHNMGSWETRNICCWKFGQQIVTSRTGMTWPEGMPGTAFASHMLVEKMKWFMVATVCRWRFPQSYAMIYIYIHIHTIQRSTKNDPQRNLMYKLKYDKCNNKNNKQNNPCQSTLRAKPSTICVGVAFKPIEKISVPIGSRCFSGWTYHLKATPRTRK